MTDDITYLNVPVPAPLMPKVTALIHDFFAARTDGHVEQPAPAAATASPSPAVGHVPHEDEPRYVVPRQGTFTHTELETLLDWHNEPALGILRTISTRALAGEDTPWGVLQDLTGLSIGQARSNLAALTKRVERITGDKKWPITLHDHGAGTPSPDRYIYGAPTDIATAIVTILDGRQP